MLAFEEGRSRTSPPHPVWDPCASGIGRSVLRPEVRAKVLELWIELLREHLLRREASEAGEGKVS